MYISVLLMLDKGMKSILKFCQRYMEVAIFDTVGKPRTDSVPPTMQSQIPKSRDVKKWIQ
jgi:hypothetical protein